MDGSDRILRRKSFKERLRWKGIGCCGPTLGLRRGDISVRDDDEDDESQFELHDGLINMAPASPEIRSTAVCFGQTPGRSGMNLATALAAERQLRSAHDMEGEIGISPRPRSRLSPRETPRPSPRPRLSPRLSLRESPRPSPRPSPSPSQSPYRVSLMRLLEETEANEEDDSVAGSDSVCCVCMIRKKGAAFIPCGHTFCRVCSRELWLNRGTCPLCSRTIVEILDIF